MSLADFKEFLLLAVKEDLITEDEAGQLLAKFNKGEVPDNVMPLLPQAGIETVKDHKQIEAALVVLLLALNKGQGYKLKNTDELLALPGTERESIRELVQDDFITQGTHLANDLERHKNTARWQGVFQSAIVYYMIQQSALGYGRRLTEKEVHDLSYAVMVQTAYGSRFAADIAVHSLLAKPMSSLAIAARSHLYAGAGRAEGFRGVEAALEDKYDYLVDYICKDDKRTCDPCIDAEAKGPYKPLKGPYPGEVCQGAGHCRCYRQLRLIPRKK